MAKAKLSDDVKMFIVQALACFDSPSTVAAAVNKLHRVTVSRQLVENYDPEKMAGRAVSERWRILFEATRKAFLEDTSKIAIAHRAVRLRTLQRLAEKAETQGNIVFTASLLEQAAKECGDMFTNRREFTGNSGAPLIPAMTLEMFYAGAKEVGAPEKRT